MVLLPPLPQQTHDLPISRIGERGVPIHIHTLSVKRARVCVPPEYMRWSSAYGAVRVNVISSARGNILRSLYTIPPQTPTVLPLRLFGSSGRKCVCVCVRAARAKKESIS